MVAGLPLYLFTRQKIYINGQDDNVDHNILNSSSD